MTEPSEESVGETRRERHQWYDYKVQATIASESPESCAGDTTHHRMESDWIEDREIAIKLAEELSDNYSPEIHTRQHGSYAPKDFDAVPGRGDAR